MLLVCRPPGLRFQCHWLPKADATDKDVTASGLLKRNCNYRANNVYVSLHSNSLRSVNTLPVDICSLAFSVFG